MTARPTPKWPFLVMGPDIHGPVLYSRHGTLKAAQARKRWQGDGLTIVKVIEAGDSLDKALRDRLDREDRERKEWAQKNKP